MLSRQNVTKMLLDVAHICLISLVFGSRPLPGHPDFLNGLMHRLYIEASVMHQYNNAKRVYSDWFLCE